ncbi:protein FAR-RED IMPAIRED RESPONSE 1-like [Bidens hawaiensis]|uniref:protein FAR-RED IMPAIRED RESPONSE 1-like n=1 Tax=Bidens hawaiensis TaxID=980011 RepID=UPI004049A792
MYKWPFVQYIGVTSTSKSFCIAHTVLLRERQTDFTWALEHLKGMLEDSIEPRVVVTDRDSALMNACKQVFSNATRNLSRWHIRENIKKKWKGIYDSEAREDFALLWTVLCESPTFDDYEYNCVKLQEMLCNIGKEKVWDYIHHSWLDRDKEKIVSCWMADRLNFGETTTNRVENQHANLKRHLNGANNALHALAAYALEVIEAQKVSIGATFEQSRIKLKKDHNIQVFYMLHYKVLIKVLMLLEKEYGKLEKMTESGHTCRHQLRTSMGLPCACEPEQHLNKGVPIPLKSIDPFWRKLDFDPVVA